MDVTTPNQKLPVFAIVLGAWGSVPRNLGLFFRLYWPWLAVLAVCGLSAGAGILINSLGDTPSQTLIGGAALVPYLVGLVAFVLAMPAIAVGWSRGIYSGERPTTPIRIDGAVWSYIGNSILLMLMAGIVAGVIVLLIVSVGAISLGLGEGPMSLERLAALNPFLQLVAIPIVFLLSRFSLVLPAVAVGQKMSFAESFRRTRGNTLRLAFMSGLVYLPFAIAQGVFQVLLIALPGSGVTISIAALLVVIAFFFYVHSYFSFGTLALKQLAPVEMDDAVAA